MLFNDYKNVKTIIFSELPQADKVKYFNFLLENDINFSRDEAGNYVALVKVLNPAFYGGGAPQEQKTQQNQQLPTNSNLESKRKIQDSKRMESKGNTETEPIMEGKPRSSSQANRYNQSGFSGSYGGTGGSNARGQNSSVKKLKNVKNNHFEKEKKAVAKKNYLEIFEGRYQKFLQSVNPLLGVRGKKMNLHALKYAIEEIYSIRFINDTNTVNNNPNEDVEPVPFPTFVFEFLTNKFTKKPMVDQHSLDLLLSVDFYMKTDDEVATFAKFLNEEYEPDDLEFFLYVRSCIEKEMKVMFIEIARETMKKQYNEDFEENECALNVKSCLNVANSVYGNEEEDLLNSFMKKIEDILTHQKNLGMKKNVIKAGKILQITLEDYHVNKFGGGNNNQSDGEGNKDTQGMVPTEKPKNNDPLNKDHSNTYNDLQKNLGGGNIANQEEKISRLKAIIGAYIKEKELDVFFSKLLTSYMIYEKSKKNIEETLASIKDLVSRKVNLLINILFAQDEQAWFNSLKLKGEDQAARDYFYNLLGLIEQMMQFDKLQEIPEELVETFAQTLLSTPELNNQINKLVMKRFE